MTEEKDYLKEIEKESEETIKEFSEDVSKVISKVANYTEKDINKLYVLILENLKDLSDLEGSSEEIRRKIANLHNTRDRLNFQKDMTREDILEANYIKIYIFYLISSYLIMTPDVIEYIKRFIALCIIGFVSYDLNARYFTSDRHKRKARLGIAEIDKNVEISKYDIQTLEKFREMYLTELRAALSKLTEISNYNDREIIKANDRLLSLIKQLELDTDLEEEVKKLKIRRR